MDQRLDKDEVFTRLTPPITPAEDPVTDCVVVAIALADSEAFTSGVIGIVQVPESVRLYPEFQVAQILLELNHFVQ